MSRNSVATPRGVVARARTTRSPRSHRPVTTLALALGLALAAGSTPKVAYAEPGMAECIAGIEELVGACKGDDAGWARKYACEWAGGVGIIACSVAEASKLAARMLPNVY